MRFSDEDRPVLIGHDAVNIHKDEKYVLRFPIKFGYFNVSPEY